VHPISNLEAQAWNTLHSMYKVWIKRNYREIHSIDEGTYKIVQKNVIECETCRYYSIKPFYHSFVCPFINTVNFSIIPLIHTLYILWSVFHACASRLLMGCTYNQCNGKKYLIWLYHNNQTKICQSLFGMWFIHKGPVYTSSTYISIGQNICYGWIKFCPHWLSEIWI